MDIWRICALFCILGCVSGTINQYFDVFNGLAGIGCLEIDDTIPDNVVISKDVENARGTHDAESCDTLFSAYVKDIPVLIGGRVYNTAVRWDPSKGVFNVKTLLYDIPEAQTNNTVVLILQQVNSFALEFKSCQVGEKREFRIHLQVEITSGTTIQIDAGLSENYAFVDAGITLFGIYTASAGVQMTWNEWSSMALIGHVQLVALGKDRGYISSLGSVAKLIGNGPKEIVIDLQNTLQSANRCLKRAQEYLLEKQRALKSAHSIFDAGVAKLEDAKQYFEEKKHDLQKKRKQWKNDQENADLVCKIQQCRLICIPGLKLDTCYTRDSSFLCPQMTDCMFNMEDPVCVLNNIWCKTKRGATHVSLEFAQGGARLAESVLDGAQTALKAAQVVVDKSRVILDRAGTALTIIEKGIEHIRYVNEKVINGLEAVEYLINYGVDLAGLIMEAVSENVIDVRDCGVIDFAYSKDIMESGIEIFCEVNVRGRGYKRVSRRLRLCDMFTPTKCTDIGEIEHVH